MGSSMYKKLCYKLDVKKQRTLMDQIEFEDVIIKDDSVMMQLRQDCTYSKCKAQLLEPKLKKCLQNIKLNVHHELTANPKCIFCKRDIPIPFLKITLGGFSRTYRPDRQPRHKLSEVHFLSAEQIFWKVHKMTHTSNDRISNIEMKLIRHDHPELFWNIIFYMSKNGLPYDMFLPYLEKKELEQIEAKFESINSHCIVEFKEDSNVARAIHENKKKPTHRDSLKKSVI